jgi:hypothetical protein
VAAHGGGGLVAVGGEEAVEDRLVLGDGDLQAPRRQDQAPRPVEIGAGVLDHRLDLGELHLAEDDVVELQVALVEALLVVDLGGGALVAHVALQGLDQFGAVILRDDPHGLRLQRLADQHVFDHIGDADQRDRRAALRQDVHQALGLQPRQGLGHREAGDAEPLAERALVEGFAGGQIERHNGLAERVGDEDRDVAAARGRRRRQKLVGTFFACHANMLVVSPEQFNCMLVACPGGGQ